MFPWIWPEHVFSSFHLNFLQLDFENKGLSNLVTFGGYGSGGGTEGQWMDTIWHAKTSAGKMLNPERPLMCVRMSGKGLRYRKKCLDEYACNCVNEACSKKALWALGAQKRFRSTSPFSIWLHSDKNIARIDMLFKKTRHFKFFMNKIPQKTNGMVGSTNTAEDSPPHWQWLCLHLPLWHLWTHTSV